MNHGGAGCATLDLWMPLDFGQFLRKTSQLNPDQSVEYLRSLAIDWIEKKARAHAKASWAARVRWARARGIDPSTLEHVEHLASMQIASLLSSTKMQRWIANAQKRSEKSSKAARARWAKRASAPSIAFAAPHERVSPSHTLPVSTDLNSTIIPPPPSGFFQSLAGGILDALRSNLASGAFAGARNPVRGAKRSTRGMVTPLEAGIAHPDARYDPCREMVMEFWRRKNPSQPDCPWAYRDRNALEDLLTGSNQLTPEIFKNWLDNRAASAVNPSQLPRRWLRKLWEYASGPLDRYGKPPGQEGWSVSKPDPVTSMWERKRENEPDRGFDGCTAADYFGNADIPDPSGEKG